METDHGLDRLQADIVEGRPQRPETSKRSQQDWCCQTGLNCRPLHYQWSALPLSYGSVPWNRKSQGGPARRRSLPQGHRRCKRIRPDFGRLSGRGGLLQPRQFPADPPAKNDLRGQHRAQHIRLAAGGEVVPACQRSQRQRRQLSAIIGSPKPVAGVSTDRPTQHSLAFDPSPHRIPA